MFCCDHLVLFGNGNFFAHDRFVSFHTLLVRLKPPFVAINNVKMFLVVVHCLSIRAPRFVYERKAGIDGKALMDRWCISHEIVIRDVRYVWKKLQFLKRD